MWKEAARGKSRFTIRDPLADGRCSQTVLDTLPTMDVGRLLPAEEDAGSEASEREWRERRERVWEQRAEAEVLGVGGVEQPLFLPTPFFAASAEEE